MVHVLLAVAALCGVTDVWSAPPDTRIFPNSAPVGRPEAAIRLYAAAGESESVQVCIQADRRGWESVEVSGGALGDGVIPAPSVRRVGYVRARGPDGAPGMWPDPLLPFAPFDVPRRETRALWLTYNVPADTPPGLYEGTVTLAPANAPSRDVPVTLEVFGFALPETPALPVWADLNHAQIAAAYGMLRPDLSDWTPIYGSVTDFGFAIGPWDAPGLVRVGPDKRSATEELKARLHWLMTEGEQGVAPISPAQGGLSPFPEPDHPAAQDPLQLYFFDMAAWLRERGWLDRAVYEVMPLPGGDAWQQVRAAYFRARRADDRIPLAIEGPLHPYFERYVDVWIVPFEQYQPAAHAQLREGGSLSVDVAYEAESVTASSAGPPEPDGIVSRAVDAYDGSLFTAWWSATAPTEKRPQVLELHFVEPVVTESFRVGWRPEAEPGDVIVRTAFDGRVFSRASVDWEMRRGAHAYDQSWSEGFFKTEKRFLAIQFEFRSSLSGGPVAVSELEFGPPGTEPEAEPGDIAVWLRPPATGFPSLAAGAAPIDARILPWICWGHDAAGLRLSRLVQWPERWHAPALRETDIWQHDGPVTSLFYPAVRGLMPSIRAALLHDGIEDYAYLTLSQERLEALKTPGPEAVQNAMRRRMYSNTMRPELAATYATEIPEWRKAIGRFLTGLPAIDEDDE